MRRVAPLLYKQSYVLTHGSHVWSIWPDVCCRMTTQINENCENLASSQQKSHIWIWRHITVCSPESICHVVKTTATSQSRSGNVNRSWFGAPSCSSWRLSQHALWERQALPWTGHQAFAGHFKIAKPTLVFGSWEKTRGSEKPTQTGGEHASFTGPCWLADVNPRPSCSCPSC